MRLSFAFGYYIINFEQRAKTSGIAKMEILILGLVLFLGIHCLRIVAPHWRQRMVDKLGLGPWKGIYSVASLLGLGMIIWGYGQARAETEYLYLLPEGTRHAAYGMMLVSLILAVASDLPVGYIRNRVRHPLLIAAIIWAIAHLMMNGDTASILLFGAFLIWALIALVSVIGRREPAPELKTAWADVAAFAGGITIWLAIAWWLHEWLIGVPVIA